MHIRKGDTVEVICGDDKGTRGRVLSVDSKKGKLVVEGINRVYKHMRKSQRAAQGGRLSKEMPIDASNVMNSAPDPGCREHKHDDRGSWLRRSRASRLPTRSKRGRQLPNA